MIDPAAGGIEIRIVPSTRANLIYNMVELAWLTRYPLPSKVKVDRGKMNSSWNLKPGFKPTTV